MNWQEIKPHDPARAVKGGQFRGGYDCYAPGAEIRSWITGKIAHTARDKTRCDGTKTIAVGLVQFIIRETIIVDGDRHFTGFNIFVAKLDPIPEMAAPGPAKEYRHVEEGVLLGHVRNFIHLASKQDDRLRKLLGI
jgi:hypothetical protein